MADHHTRRRPGKHIDLGRLDATADGDANDFAVWTARFGSSADHGSSATQSTAATSATLPFMPASSDNARSAPVRRAAWLVDEGASAVIASRRPTFQVVDAALASAVGDLGDETESSELQERDFNVVDWDEALATL